MKQHPLSAAYPAMTTEEFQTLKDSIEVIGVQTPATLFEGAVLDGWHRWTAASELSINCPVVDLGDVDPLQFVRAANKARRHLTKSQLALVEVTLVQWTPVGRPNVAATATLTTNAEMALNAGVSSRTIRDAKIVEAKAAPEVKAAVKAGTMSVEKAAATTKPERVQAPEEPEISEVDRLRAQLTEVQAVAHEALADNTRMGELFEADDKIAALYAENKKLRAQVATLTQRVNGLMGERNEAVRAAKSWQRKAQQGDAT